MAAYIKETQSLYSTSVAMPPQELYSKGMCLTEMENELENGCQLNSDELDLSRIIVSEAHMDELWQGLEFFFFWIFDEDNVPQLRMNA